MGHSRILENHMKEILYFFMEGFVQPEKGQLGQ